MSTAAVDQAIILSNKQSVEEELDQLKIRLKKEIEDNTKVKESIGEVIGILLLGRRNADYLSCSRIKNSSDINEFLSSRNEKGIIYLLEKAISGLNSCIEC